MSFSPATKEAAMKRAGRRCECKRSSHGHPYGRCPTKLTKANTEYHHKLAVASGGGDGLSNCEVLCRSCHQRVRRPR